MDTTEIEEKIGYEFTRKDLMRRALTRKAYASEKRQKGEDMEDQEIFRTLGDAVLKLIIVDRLLKSGYDTREKITNKKIATEKGENLAKIGKELGIAQFIKLGIGEEKQKANEKQTVIAETLEALIGAIYLDCEDFYTSKKVIIKWFPSLIDA